MNAPVDGDAAGRLELRSSTRFLECRRVASRVAASCLDNPYAAVRRDIRCRSSPGAVADRGAVQEVQLAVAARPGDLDIGVWRAVLAYDTLADDNGSDPLGHGATA